MGEAENPTHLAAEIDDRREMPRCAVDVPATLDVLSQGTMMVGRMTELSLSGCRILLPKALSRSASAAVECTFKIRGVGFRLSGIVMWTEDHLAGVEFGAMSSHSCDELMEVLCEVELENNAKLPAAMNSAVEAPAADTSSDVPAIEAILAEAAARNRAQPRLNAGARPTAGAWNPFAGMAMGAGVRKAPDFRPEAPGSQIAPQMSPQVSQQAAPAQPREQEGRIFFPAAPVAPAPAAQLPASRVQFARQPNRGRERRITHRCGVDTSAIIDLVKVGSKLSGQILDLSVGGCRIRTAEKFPVGIYTRIETEFKLHGLPVRLGGVIQAIHDRNTVGIRFLDMSERKKEQVAELVAELEESQGG